MCCRIFIFGSEDSKVKPKPRLCVCLVYAVEGGDLLQALGKLWIFSQHYCDKPQQCFPNWAHGSPET